MDFEIISCGRTNPNGSSLPFPLQAGGWFEDIRVSRRAALVLVWLVMMGIMVRMTMTIAMAMVMMMMMVIVIASTLP